MSEPASFICPGLLRRVAVAVESVQTPWPPTALSLLSIVQDKADATWLLDVAADVTGSKAYCRTLLRMADRLETTRQQTLQVSLATTGPDAGGLTRPTFAVVRSLFAEARHDLLVAGFAIHQGQKIFALYAERRDQDKNLRARLVLNLPRLPGDTSTATAIVSHFGERFRSQEWPGHRLPEVYFDPRALANEASDRASFHAKCIVADRRLALVTSANPTEAAYERNIELGLVVEGGRVAATIDDWFNGLIVDHHLERLPLI